MKRFGIDLFLLMVLMASTLVYGRETVNLVAFPPYVTSSPEGKAVGEFSEMIRGISKANGLDVHINVVPPSRYFSLLSGKQSNLVLAHATKILGNKIVREHEYCGTPITTLPLSYITRADSLDKEIRSTRILSTMEVERMVKSVGLYKGETFENVTKVDFIPSMMNKKRFLAAIEYLPRFEYLYKKNKYSFPYTSKPLGDVKVSYCCIRCDKKRKDIIDLLTAKTLESIK